MEKSKKQLVVITSYESDVNKYLETGWKVVSVTAQHISNDGGNIRFGRTVNGGFCFIIEKEYNHE